MNIDGFSVTLWTPLPAIFPEIAHKFFIFLHCVSTDAVRPRTRFVRGRERLGLCVDILESGILIDVFAAFVRFAVRLQATPHISREIADNRRTGLMPLLRQPDRQDISFNALWRGASVRDGRRVVAIEPTPYGVVTDATRAA